MVREECRYWDVMNGGAHTYADLEIPTPERQVGPVSRRAVVIYGAAGSKKQEEASLSVTLAVLEACKSASNLKGRNGENTGDMLRSCSEVSKRNSCTNAPQQRILSLKCPKR